MTPEKRDDYIIRVLDGTSTAEELLEVKNWVEESPENEHYFVQLKKAWNLTNGVMPSPEREAHELKRFLGYIRNFRRKRILRFVLRYAAILILPLCIVGYWMWYHQAGEVMESSPVVQIMPGEYKAELIMANGQIHPLNPAQLQNIRVQEKMIAKNGLNGIVYETNVEQLEEQPLETNILKTPRGGEYAITLSDGSRVHLNAASELRFPVAFSGAKREVFFSGEAYFEIAKDSTRPFIVHTDAVNVKVYGTEFNLNTYSSIGTQTVLVSGKVGISGKHSSEERILRPNQLAVYDEQGVFQEIRNVEIFPYVAWKEGQFVFQDESLEHILNVLSRWYDVDVQYRDIDVKDCHFTGHIEKYEDIQIILNAISRMVGIRFEIEDKTIIVSK